MMDMMKVVIGSRIYELQWRIYCLSQKKNSIKDSAEQVFIDSNSKEGNVREDEHLEPMR